MRRGNLYPRLPAVTEEKILQRMKRDGEQPAEGHRRQMTKWRIEQTRREQIANNFKEDGRSSTVYTT